LAGSRFGLVPAAVRESYASVLVAGHATHVGQDDQLQRVSLRVV
jgi:hypothetical protein